MSPKLGLRMPSLTMTYECMKSPRVSLLKPTASLGITAIQQID
jgi:hypothetical protein